MPEAKEENLRMLKQPPTLAPDLLTKDCSETEKVPQRHWWPGPSKTCVGVCREFLLYKCWRILPGIFLEDDFSGHFSHKNEENKIRRQNRRKNPAAQK